MGPTLPMMQLCRWLCLSRLRPLSFWDQRSTWTVSRDCFPNSIHTTDLKHIVDNLLHECLDSMSLWPKVLEGMRALEKLLRGPLMRERFQATCFQEQDPDRKLFDTWSVSLKSLRWQCVTEFTLGLLKLEYQLRSKWSKRAFLRGAGSFRPKTVDQNTDYGAAIASIDNAICSKSFWCGVALVHDISYQAEFVGNWAEACPCCKGGIDEQSAPLTSAVVSQDVEQVSAGRPEAAPPKEDCSCSLPVSRLPGV